MADVLKKNLTYVIFWSVVSISLLTAVTVLVLREHLFLLFLSVGMNLWSLVQSERGGFVQAREMRRAFEPPRHFNGIQTLTVIFLILVQLVIAALLLLS
ncbi:hypothetical protein GQ464_001600 [Rhodocaloribacter litoris]|uniref:hypothetical protein n=1 Tax=Rhodocaloribacter litoris TaxID=2558931 RepID=UPI001422382A|nr:hypothetical protein [Rhodocaloribacter litoris]QXD15664.1 hypothetical protein GQ464_001600 [Rhodocaloribacter litoris]GIV61597.1 MAG: hypothetical protein KatS3mg044_0463 [Rhodothermaceae bacterium]